MVWAIAASTFAAVAAQHPGMANALLLDLVRRFPDADRKRIEFGALPAIGRVAARLVELVERIGSRTSVGHVIDLPISQAELAGWTGASREAVAKALRTLRELGLVSTERRRITVRDLEQLAAPQPLMLDRQAPRVASLAGGLLLGVEPAPPSGRGKQGSQDGPPSGRVVEREAGAGDREVGVVAPEEDDVPPGAPSIVPPAPPRRG